MSFKDTLSSLDQLISRKNDFFYNTLKNYQDQLEPFSGHESQDTYCWLEKFENQFKSCGRKLDPAYLAATLAEFNRPRGDLFFSQTGDKK